MDLEGRTAIVTGSAVRIGREICIQLASHGANIVVNYLIQELKIPAERLKADAVVTGRAREVRAVALHKP